MAKAAGRRLVLNEEALAHLQRFSEKLGGNLHPLNEKQALMPATSTLIPNPVGTACGFYLTHNGRFLFFLPGVPGEMARMLDETVIPFIFSRVRRRTSLQTKVFKVFGPSEAEVDSLVKGIAEGVTGISIAFRVNFPEIQVKLRVEGHDEALVAAALDRVSETARQKLHDDLNAFSGARSFPVPPIPGAVWRGLGRSLDLVTRFVPIETTARRIWLADCGWTGGDASRRSARQQSSRYRDRRYASTFHATVPVSAVATVASHSPSFATKAMSMR